MHAHRLGYSILSLSLARLGDEHDCNIIKWLKLRKELKQREENEDDLHIKRDEIHKKICSQTDEGEVAAHGGLDPQPKK